MKLLDLVVVLKQPPNADVEVGEVGTGVIKIPSPWVVGGSGRVVMFLFLPA